MSYISLPKKGLNDLSQSINNAKKFLIEAYAQLLTNKNHPYDYDGGVSIILALMKQKYNVDVGINMECTDLSDCANKFYRISDGIYKFSLVDEDIFQESFLKELYLEHKSIENYSHFITLLQKYLNTQDNQLYTTDHINGLISFFNVQNRTYYKLINVGLALVALESYHKAEINGNSQYQFLFKKTVSGLWTVFNNGLQLEEQYMDPMKAMSLWILFMLREVKKNQKVIQYIKCIIKEQATNGQWINSDVFDGNNLVNDILLTSINLMNLIDYQTTELPNHPVEKEPHPNYVTLEPVYLDDNIKKQEFGLTAFQSKELFQNTESMSPQMRTYLVFLGFFILAFFLINNCNKKK